MGTHLPAGQIVLRMICQSRIVYLTDPGVRSEKLGHLQGVGTVPLHSHGQGFQVLEHHPGFQGRYNGTDKLGRIPADILHQRFGTDNRAADDRGVAG